MAAPLGTMSRAEVETLLRRYSVDVAKKLLGGCGLQLQAQSESAALASQGFSLLGIVGFTGRQIAGTLVLGATKEPLGCGRPQGGSHRDWIAELANQLLGGVKNRVLPHGIEFYSVPPTVVSGLKLAPMTSETTFDPVIFSCADGAVCLWIEVDVSDPYPLSRAPRPSEIPLEGEVLIF